MLSLEEEAVIVAFRKHTLLPLDDGLGLEEVCRKAGVSQQTYYLYGRLSRCKSILN